MSLERKNALMQHKLWLDSEGEQGAQLALDGVHMASFKPKELTLLTSSFLTDCEFLQMQISAVDFYGTEFHSGKFEGTTVSEVSFNKSDISYLHLDHCTFDRVRFVNADIYDTRFLHCRFINCSFDGSNLNHVCFEHCVFDQTTFELADLDEVRFDEGTQLNNDLSGASFIRIEVGTATAPQYLEGKAALAWISEHQG